MRAYAVGRRVVAVVLVLAAAPAAADDVADPPDTVPKSVTATLDGTTATFKVRYLVDVAGPSLDYGLANLALPRAGSVTGAVVTVDGAVHRLALDPAEHAAQMFEQIGQLEANAYRRWVVNLTNGALADTVGLDLAAPHDARLMIDLDVSAPTCFADDVRYVAVPKAWEHVVPRTLRKATGELDTRCDPVSEEHVWIGFATREVAGKPFGDQRLGMTAGKLDLAIDHIAHVELDLAKRISQAPPDLVTVFVVDGSRSMTTSQATAQQAIIQSYVKLAPRSRVQVVEYDRKAHALLPSWMPSSEAAARITRELGAMTANNGSNVDVGLAEAASWLARIDGTKRIVLFTDQLVPARLETIDAATLPEGTLVHVVALDDTTGTIDRNDDVTFANLAKATEGISVAGRVDENDLADALVLVRPLAFEHVQLTAPGWTALEVSDAPRECRFDQATFGEGVSCEWWAQGEASAGPIKIEGVVWNHPVTRILRPDASAGRTIARQLGKLSTGLSDGVREEIDRAALAVNAVWSMVGSWGGGGGYADVNNGGSGFGTFGCACGGGSSDSIGMSGFGRSVPRLDLKAQIEHGIAKCHRDHARVEIDLELTLDEIVDVGVRTADATIRDCVIEAVWDLALVLGDPQPHAHGTVVLD